METSPAPQSRRCRAFASTRRPKTSGLRSWFREGVHKLVDKTQTLGGQSLVVGQTAQIASVSDSASAKATRQRTGLKVVGNRVLKADADIPQEVPRFHKVPECPAVQRFLSMALLCFPDSEGRAWIRTGSDWTGYIAARGRLPTIHTHKDKRR